MTDWGSRERGEERKKWVDVVLESPALRPCSINRAPVTAIPLSSLTCLPSSGWWDQTATSWTPAIPHLRCPYIRPPPTSRPTTPYWTLKLENRPFKNELGQLSVLIHGRFTWLAQTGRICRCSPTLCTWLSVSIRDLCRCSASGNGLLLHVENCTVHFINPSTGIDTSELIITHTVINFSFQYLTVLVETTLINHPSLIYWGHTCIRAVISPPPPPPAMPQAQ